MGSFLPDLHPTVLFNAEGKVETMNELAREVLASFPDGPCCDGRVDAAEPFAWLESSMGAFLAEGGEESVLPHGEWMIRIRRSGRGEPKGAAAVIEAVAPNNNPGSVLANLLETITAPVFLKNSQGVYIGCNSAFSRLFGKTPLEMIGLTAYDIAPAELAEEYREADRRVLSSGKRIVYEAVALIEGVKSQVEIHKAPFCDREGQVAGIIGTGFDLTERRRVEEDLDLSERKYRHLFRTMAQGVVYQDADGTITAANPAAERILGLTLAQLQGRTSVDPCWHAVREDGRPFPGEEHPSMVSLKTGREVQGTIMGVYNPRIGEYRWIRVHAIPQFRNEESSPCQAYTTFEDITEHKQLTDQLREKTRALGEANSFLKELLAASPAAIISVNRKGEVLSWNAAAEKFFGWTEEEVAGRPIPVIPLEKVSEFRDRLNNQLGGRSQMELPVVRQRRDGTLIDLFLSTAPLRNADKKIIGTIKVYTDRTEHRRAQEALDAERTFLQTVIDGVVHPIAVLGKQREILLCNRAAKNLLPPMDPESDLRCYQLHHQKNTPCMEETSCPITEVLRTGRPARSVYRHHIQDGETRTFEVDASPLRLHGAIEGVIEVLRDITPRLQAQEEVRRKDERVKYLAFHDCLTHLPNRALFHDRLQHALDKARRSGGKSALLYLDLDLFKKINDSLGHETGDRVLCEIARRLRRTVRKADTLARLGGDEFVVILEEVTQVADISRAAEKILTALADAVTVGEYRLYVTSSVGISVFPADASDIEGLLGAAESAMYRVKEKGRNGYQFYHSKMNRRAQENLLLEAHLREAQEKRQFVLHYQPQIELGTGRLVGAEALLRWYHPERGMIRPDHFIPLAEETGLIVPIGEQVLQEACRQLKAWMDGGLPPMQMSVNVSARQFRQRNLVHLVAGILEKTGVAPELLELEITESTIMEDVEAATVAMNELNTLGVSISIDDFGTGYSSLAYLKNFPLRKLKVDRTFVRDIENDSKDASIVSAVISLARNLGLQVVAEGIETLSQLAYLQQEGCTLGQGYLFSRPVPAEELTVFASSDPSIRLKATPRAV